LNEKEKTWSETIAWVEIEFSYQGKEEDSKQNDRVRVGWTNVDEIDEKW